MALRQLKGAAMLRLTLDAESVDGTGKWTAEIVAPYERSGAPSGGRLVVHASATAESSCAALLGLSEVLWNEPPEARRR